MLLLLIEAVRDHVTYSMYVKLCSDFVTSAVAVMCRQSECNHLQCHEVVPMFVHHERTLQITILHYNIRQSLLYNQENIHQTKTYIQKILL